MKMPVVKKTHQRCQNRYERLRNWLRRHGVSKGPAFDHASNVYKVYKLLETEDGDPPRYDVDYSIDDAMILKLSDARKAYSPQYEYNLLQQLCEESVSHQDHVCLPVAMEMIGSSLCMMMPRAKDDLYALVDPNVACRLQDDERENVLHQILGGVSFLHNKKVIHGDIKLENVVYFCDNQQPFGKRFEIIDFGLSLQVQQGADAVVCKDPGGSNAYAAPELLWEQSRVCTYANDLWAVGIIYYILLQTLDPHFPWEKASLNEDKFKNYLAAFDSDTPLPGFRRASNGLMYELLHPCYLERVSAQDAVTKLETQMEK